MIVGYRLIDVRVDDQQLGAEAAVLGSISSASTNGASPLCSAMNSAPPRA
jgi:hypothetical protein